MRTIRSLAPITLAILLAACASRQPAPAQATAPAAPAAAPATASQPAKSRDGSFSGEILGTPVPNSKFAKLRIGMHMNEVQNVFNRAPDRLHSYESGKRWIPFYFGNDARRMQVLYRGEGCLIFTGGNVWGGASGDLISIHHDASGACYQP